jgi:hypothetical protein
MCVCISAYVEPAANGHKNKVDEYLRDLGQLRAPAQYAAADLRQRDSQGGLEANFC